MSVIETQVGQEYEEKSVLIKKKKWVLVTGMEVKLRKLRKLSEIKFIFRIKDELQKWNNSR